MFEEVRTRAIELAPWAAADNPADHDPKWHQFGVLGHIRKVIENALRIFQLTNINIINLAAWHDIGKFIVRVEKEPGKYSFKGHESASAEYLQNNGFSDEELFLVANHGVIRGKSTVEEITTLCGGEKELMKKLVLICAADTSGKGFPPAQKAQRQELAPKFVELAQVAGLDTRMVEDITLNW